MKPNIALDDKARQGTVGILNAVLADEFNDMGTNDFLIGLMEQHEKMAWMLRAFLDGKR